MTTNSFSQKAEAVRIRQEEMSTSTTLQLCCLLLSWGSVLSAPQEVGIPTIAPCGIRCAAPFVLDPIACECQCLIGCPNGTYLDERNCQCLDLPCPVFVKNPCTVEGTYWDTTLCRCMCKEPVQCPAGFVSTLDRCDCLCRPRRCGPNEVFDKLICQCVPKHDPSCPPGFTYNPVLCDCVCTQNVECRENFLWDQNQCQCVCPRSEICRPGFIWSQRDCQCICTEAKECRSNFIFDNQTCDCVCDPKHSDKDCPAGHIFDREICDCVRGVRPSCQEPFVYSEKECDCVCAEQPNCINRQVWDKDICKCVCLPFRCNAGYFNPRLCDCTDRIPIDPIPIDI